MVAAAHLHDGAEHLTGNVDPAIAGENQGTSAAGLDGRAMHYGCARQTQVDHLSIDVRELHRNGGGLVAFSLSAFLGHRENYSRGPWSVAGSQSISSQTTKAP